jgi:hypothetical protein
MPCLASDPAFVLLHRYTIVLGTFGAIVAIGNLIAGMAIGYALSVFIFAAQYGQSRSSRLVRKSSKVIRGFKQRSALLNSRSAIVAVELKGYIFFNSASRILREVKEYILVEQLLSSAGLASGDTSTSGTASAVSDLGAGDEDGLGADAKLRSRAGLVQASPTRRGFRRVPKQL